MTVVDGTQATIAVGRTTLLRLLLISDFFVAIQEMPAVLDAIGWVIPPPHAVPAAVTATCGGSLAVTFLGHPGVVALWVLATGLVSGRWVCCQPRRFSRGKQLRVVLRGLPLRNPPKNIREGLSTA